MVRNGQILGILEGPLARCLDRLDCDRNGAWTQCAHVGQLSGSCSHSSLQP